MLPNSLLRTAVAAAFSFAPALATDFVLIPPDTAARALIPSAANGGSTLGTTWTAGGFDDASWMTGNTGIGYDSDTGSGGNYTSLIGLNVGAMEDTNGSVFIRVAFNVAAAELPNFRQLKLNMKIDDGFVAYLNGTKVTSLLEPANLAWNSNTLNGQTHAATLATYEEFDITPHLGHLQAGANVLALHGLNATNGSSDLLLVPQLVASDVPPPPPLAWPEISLVEVPGIGAVSFGTAVRHAGDGSNRLFIVERQGVIRVLYNGVVSTFLDIQNRVKSSTSTGDEQGLFGIAFPPGFGTTKSHFYVDYTTEVPAENNNQRLSRFSLVPTVPPVGPINAADPNSEAVLMSIPDPFGNHNGGDIYFGTDGFLYLSLGDGGSGDDPGNRAQNPNEFWGKMLRLDVEGAIGTAQNYLIPPTNPFRTTVGAKPEIFHLGLRNPWRWSFDRLTGDMWIGDVGQNTVEEIDFVAGNAPGMNFGWRRYEGTPLRPGEPQTGGTAITIGTLTFPVTETLHSAGDASITGGFVYRGSMFPRMQGIYFFADYVGSRLYGLQRDASSAWRRQTLIPSVGFGISSFGEDESGELYAVRLTGPAGGRILQVRDSRDSRYLEIQNVVRGPQGNVSFSFGTEIGNRYQAQVTTDLVTWSPIGAEILADALVETFTEPPTVPPPDGRRLFRVVEL